MARVVFASGVTVFGHGSAVIDHSEEPSAITIRPAYVPSEYTEAVQKRVEYRAEKRWSIIYFI